MFQIAKISFDAGALVLPATDPYDREVVFEQADFYARRHGSVAVHIGRATIRAARASAQCGLVCSRCHDGLHSVSFQVDDRLLCTPCAKRAARRVETLSHPPH